VATAGILDDVSGVRRPHIEFPCTEQPYSSAEACRPSSTADVLGRLGRLWAHPRFSRPGSPPAARGSPPDSARDG
jgi:hypothetical protein